MKTSENGIRKIIGYEGKLRSLGDGRYIAYRCPANVATIFAGCTEGVHDGMIVTEAEGEAMFQKEIAKFEAGVTRLVKVVVNQNEFDALVSFSYNCGLAALAKSTVLKKLNDEDRAGAAEAFAAWNKGGGRVLKGLVARRASEAALFLKPDVAPDIPAMPQAVTESPPPVSRVTVATVTAVAATAAQTLPPAVPEAVTKSLENVHAWQGIGEQLWTLKLWAVTQPVLAGSLAISVSAFWLWSKRKAAQ